MDAMEAESARSREWFHDPGYWSMLRRVCFGERFLATSGDDVRSIADLLGIKPGESVLDLACGFGRHAFEFHKLGLSVTGVDLCTEYIREAGSKAGAGGPRFIVADMRDFVEPESFDYAVMLYNSFGYFASRQDDALVVRNCLRSLRPGGSLLIEVTGREVVRRHRSSPLQRSWWERDGVVVLEESSTDENFESMSNRWIVLEECGRSVFDYTLRLYDEAGMTGLLREAGFSGIRLFGGLDGSPYDDNARKMVAVACRTTG